jgi:hypothetical protein
MSESYLIDLGSAILCSGIVFWLAGGARWVAEKTRQLKLENDLKEKQLTDSKSTQEQG